MSINLINGDCLERLKDLSNNSIDLLFCDLPYGQTSCKWDSIIDLEKFWKEVNRVCKEECPMFFTCSTKFGVSLINSNPKNFRYDLVWVKSAPCGFLNAKKMPMKKHEMIYVFYRKLPLYDLSSHKHKFIKETENKRYGKDGTEDKAYMNRSKTEIQNKYDPPLPNSIIKTEHETAYGNNKHFHNTEQRNGESIYDPPLPNSVIRNTKDYKNDSETYGKIDRPDFMRKNGESAYEPPLPNSVIKEDVYNAGERFNNGKLYKNPRHLQKGDDPIYEPPLPNSVIKTELYSSENKEEPRELYRNEGGQYNPPLPNSVIKQERNTPKLEECFGKEYLKNKPNYREINPNLGANGTDCHIYEPPLPHSLLEIKSEKGKHATQKPTELIKWCLKYYSKEGDTILDPTMGSGSTGVACKEMNRNFIGIEMDEKIFSVAEERLK